MSDKAHLAFEVWVTMKEKIVDTIGFLQDNRTDVFSVTTLVEENVLSHRS